MQNSKEQHGERRKPSSVINEKKQRKTIEWEGLQRSLQENYSYQGNISCKDGHDKGQNSKDLTEAEEIKKGGRIHRTIQKKGFN